VLTVVAVVTVVLVVSAVVVVTVVTVVTVVVVVRGKYRCSQSAVCVGDRGGGDGGVGGGVTLRWLEVDGGVVGGDDVLFLGVSGDERDAELQQARQDEHTCSRDNQTYKDWVP
jgi:hypothetical protein